MWQKTLTFEVSFRYHSADMQKRRLDQRSPAAAKFVSVAPAKKIEDLERQLEKANEEVRSLKMQLQQLSA